MTETPPTLTIVIPTYNERERIAEIVTDVFRKANGQTRAWDGRHCGFCRRVL